MNVSELLEQFYKDTGRADLVDPVTFTDTGALRIINAGQRWLDRQMHDRHGKGRYFDELPIGTYLVRVPNVRVIEHVYIYDSTDRAELTRKDIHWLREKYSDSWRDITKGTPAYYAHSISRMMPDTGVGIDTVKAGANMMDVFASEDTEAGIIILPPPKTDLSVEVWGKFYTRALSSSDDVSWWSLLHDDILLQAAYRQVEIIHRNTQGVNDWTSAIASSLRELDHDQLEDDTNDITEMGD